MAGLLYWVPTSKSALLRPRELSRFAGVCPHGFTQTRCVGFDGAQGVLLVDGDRVPRERQVIDRERQTWLEADGYWVGIWNDAKPTSDELAVTRFPMDFNFWATLGDGGKWVIPQFRRADGESALPHMSAYRDQGDAIRLVRFVAPQFETFDVIGDRLWRHINGEDKTLTDLDILTICHEALKLNYALCDTGIELLQLMTDHGIQSIVAAMIGFAEFANSNLYLRPTPEWDEEVVNHG